MISNLRLTMGAIVLFVIIITGIWIKIQSARLERCNKENEKLLLEVNRLKYKAKQLEYEAYNSAESNSTNSIIDSTPSGVIIAPGSYSL